jgi:hypothetical protein
MYNFALHNETSNNIRSALNGMAYIEVLLEMSQLVLEHVHDLSSRCLSIWYGDAIGSTRSKLNHFVKCGVFERLNRLHAKQG